MKFLALVPLLVGSSLLFVNVLAQDRSAEKPRFPFLDPNLPLEQRVQDLLARLTVEEKATQWFNSSPAIDRLGIPAYDWWSECLHGVARAGYATVFPQAIGLAATWDVHLLQQVGTATSDEARAKHHEFVRRGERAIYQGLTFWSPNVNIFRDPRWGRGMETFGEDPYLTGKIGSAFIRGLQGDHPKYLKLVGTMKHYAVHSGPEPERHRFDAVVDERDFRETYLPHFRMCVEEAHVQSAMCAYNRYAGEPCCGSSRLLTTILRDEWGFTGYVTSDCGAVGDMYSGHKVVDTPAEAAALAIRSGTDLNCSADDADPLAAVKTGLLSEKELDQSLARLFRARFQLGMFDPPSMVPYAGIPPSVVGSASHRELALEAARKSIVLLKNQHNLLPLGRGIKRIAVIGPNGNDVLSLLGNYYGAPEKPSTPLQGIRDKFDGTTEVVYAAGAPFVDGLPLLEVIPAGALFTLEGGNVEHGLTAEYFDNGEREGKPVLTRRETSFEFNWCAELPDSHLTQSQFSVRWTGTLAPPATGTYELGTFGFRGFNIFIDNVLVASSPGGSEKPISSPVHLEGGKSYRLRIEAVARRSGTFAQILWAQPGRDLEKEAREVAESSDVVLMVLGLSPRVEGEEMNVEVPGFQGGDRTQIVLPDVQEHLLQSIVSIGKPVVLILLNGSALAIPWAKANVPAIIECWYPGQAGGAALADVLLGDYNPAGRLPVTFYATVDDLPPFESYAMDGRTYRFFHGESLYPFGHGLSYTSFQYADLGVEAVITNGEAEEKKEGRKEAERREEGPAKSSGLRWSGPVGRTPSSSLQVSLAVKNTGPLAGEEVVQLYVRALNSKVSRPVQDLRGFERIALQPRESARIEFALLPQDISYYDIGLRTFVVEPGVYEILVGASSADIRERATFRVE